MKLIVTTEEELTAIITTAVQREVRKLADSLNHAIPANEPNKLLTRKEAAKLLDITFSTLHEWTKTGVIPAYRKGARVYYKEKELITSLEKVRPAI